MKDRPIGIFDSGSGGLTVFRWIKEMLPGESVIYLGDTGRVPYGHRDPSEILLFNRQIISFLISQGAKMIILGCNTSSALALDWARKNFDLPLIGLIGPGALGASAASRNKSIGVIATQATVRSQAYSRAIGQIDPACRVTESACPKFVPLVESGQLNGPEVLAAAQSYLKPLQAAGIDTLVYGCTHYPLLEKPLRQILGPEVTFIDPARLAVDQARQILEAKNWVRSSGQAADIFYLTGPQDIFRRIAQNFLPSLKPEIKPLSLGQLENFPPAHPDLPTVL